MKILHLIDSGGLYGAEKMLLTLVYEQVAQGLDPMILSGGEPGIEEKAIEAEARRLGLPLTTWRMRPGLNFKEMGRIIRWSRDQGYDLMHSHGYKFNILAGIWPKNWRGVPLVTTLHGYVHARPFTKMWLYELLDRLMLTRMTAVVVVSGSMQSELAGKLRPHTTPYVVPNGMNIEQVERISEKPLSRELQRFLDTHFPVVLGVGRLSPEKGFDLLVKGFSKLTSLYPNIGLIIVGEGNQREKLDTVCAEQGIAGRVMMPGFYDKVPALMRQADVLAMPSKTEGLPMAALEAMTVGIPIVASRVGALPSVLEGEKGAWFLDRIDHNALLDSLKACLGNPDQTEAKVKWSKEKVATSFSSRAMGEAYREIYQSVLMI